MLSLEQQRDKFFKIFENKSLKITAEKAAANQLCYSLADSIFNAVNKKMRLKMVSHLKKANANFNSKSGFKLQVLMDLAHLGNFDNYRTYIIDRATSFKKWANLYIEQHCNSKSNTCDDSIFIELANEEIKEVISVVQNAISAAGFHDGSRWLERFCTNLSGTIEVKNREWKKELKDIEEDPECMKSFKMYLSDELSILQKSDIITHKIYLNFFELTKAAGNKLYDNIMGKTCTAKCPFCKEECDNPVSDHTVHSVNLHRPQCIGRTTWHQDKKLVIDVCNTLVASKKFYCLH